MPDAGGLVQKNQANVSNGKHIHNYSTFDRSLSYRLYNTLRFGDYTPSFVMEGVPNDEIQLNSLDRIDSLSLNAPFKGSIRKIKESFMVPNMAILPMQWDRIYAQNSNGDDVPQDANCVISEWPSLCGTLFGNAFNIVRNKLVAWHGSSGVIASVYVNTFFTALMRTLVLGEYMYSAGSLLNVSGYKYGYGACHMVYDGEDHSYDSWFDACIFKFFEHVTKVTVQVPVGSTTVTKTFVGLSPDKGIYYASSFRSLIELFRENPICYINGVYYTSDYSSNLDFILSFTDANFDLFGSSTFQVLYPVSSEDVDDVTSLEQQSLNLSRLLAYQLVCAHFYTNSSIDFMYSAELYRQYIFSLYEKVGYVTSNNSDPHCRFTWNGMKLEYDYLSGHVLKNLLFLSTNGTVNNFSNNIDVFGGNVSLGSTPYIVPLAAWAAVFGFRKSLRYGDYFTGSRPRPLAPINTDVSVANNMVSVVDITRNIQAQRFANAVMRSRSKIEEYVKSLFGRAPQPDYHNPFFLTRSEEMIFGDEVQNTGDAQTQDANSRTANFAGNVSPYTFTFHNDDMHPCIYIQIISFDVRRAYSRSVDRHFLHVDRFDMFNPDFQYIGDQAVYGIELGYSNGTNIPSVFSYQSRDMEYKQRFDVVSSGFVENLPGWVLTDQDRSRVVVANLDPDFIRSYNTELDQFFLSLTGYSLGSYFHFTCITDNNVNAKRPMAVDPQILA